jgi:hypothetical protein
VAENEEGDEEVIIHISPEDKVKKLLFQLVIDSKPISADEKKYLQESIKLTEIREFVADFF